MSDLVSYPTAAEARQACPEGYTVVADLDRARVGPGGRIQVEPGSAVRYYVMPEQARDYVQFLEHKATA